MLGGKQAIKYCKNKACGIHGFTQKQNRLPHPENQIDEGNHVINASAEPINQDIDDFSSLQIVPVSIYSGGMRPYTYVFLNSE